MSLDENDKKILNIIQKDARVSYNELGKQVGLAASTVHSRVKKMEESGVVQSFSAMVDPEKVGYKIIAWAGLSVDPTRISDVADKLTSYDEVQIVATTSGDHDIVIQLIAKNVKSLWRFINENIKPIEGMRPDMDVSTFIDTYKMTHFIKLPEKMPEKTE